VLHTSESWCTSTGWAKHAKADNPFAAFGGAALRMCTANRQAKHSVHVRGLWSEALHHAGQILGLGQLHGATFASIDSSPVDDVGGCVAC
jgi:hypothetical protein